MINYYGWNCKFQKEDKEKKPLKAIEQKDNKLTTRAEVEKVAEENPMEADEAKKIVESITDSITSGEKQERKSQIVVDLEVCKISRSRGRAKIINHSS